MIKTLYNIDTTGRLREWSVEVQDNRYRFISGLVDGQKVISAWSVAEGKNQGRANATTDAEQAERIAETYIRIRKELGYAEDMKDAGKGKAYFQPMLAARWADVKDKVTVDETHSIFVQRKLDGCVSGDMLISTDSGIVTMKDVVENGKGTRVVSFNEKTGKQELKRIIGRFKNGTDIQLENKPVWYKITLANGTVLKLTGNHRVYLPKLRCWRRVDQLTTEDFLQLQKGNTHIVKIKSIEIIPDEDRYDLEVEDNHNFYANSILVHNCRCIVKADGMWSRTGKKWISAPHIFEKLKPLFEANPDLIFDGELYFHSHDDNFNEVISLIKKTKPTPEDLEKSASLVQYWIYDLPSNPGTFAQRNAELVELFASHPDIFDKSFFLVDTYEITSKDKIQSYLEQFVSEDFEGAIVRLNKPYECKRSKNLLKVKQFQDEEYPIVRFEEGRGNLAGCAGNVVVSVNGKEVAAGLKFSHEEAQEFWLHRDQYVGKSATIKYFNKTQDGSLRFPKCIQIDRQSYE